MILILAAISDSGQHIAHIEIEIINLIKVLIVVSLGTITYCLNMIF